MKLHLQSDNQYTLIENIFIDRYMPTANGEFVKLYLYLLRCAGTGRELSVSSIADFFDHTEKDVRRALAYWEKQQLLRVRRDHSGVITDIVFLPGSSSGESERMPDDVLFADDSASGTDTAGEDPLPSGDDIMSESLSSDPVSDTSSVSSAGPDSMKSVRSGKILPIRRPIPEKRKALLRKQEEVGQLLYIAEQYIGRPLTGQELEDILYFYDDLKFSADLIEYLLEYCATKGNPGARFMEKIANDWYNEGITTVEQAKEESRLYQQRYYAILHALGIRGRGPAPAEIKYMDRWLEEYSFPLEIIEEACARTIRQTHQPEFEYIQKILESWHRSKVRCAEDIALLDQEYAGRHTAAGSAGSDSGADQPASSSVTGRTSRSAAAKRIAGTQPRDYNWSQLERDLLLAQARKGE